MPRVSLIKILYFKTFIKLLFRIINSLQIVYFVLLIIVYLNFSRKILPQNQRITTVNLTDEGRTVLEQIKKNQSDVFNTVTTSLGLSVEQKESFQSILEHAIGYFDEMLGLELKMVSVGNR